jgi:hypothetical protein
VGAEVRDNCCRIRAALPRGCRDLTDLVLLGILLAPAPPSLRVRLRIWLGVLLALALTILINGAPGALSGKLLGRADDECIAAV